MKKVCQALCIIAVLIFAVTVSIVWAADAVSVYQTASQQENPDAVSAKVNGPDDDDLFDAFEDDDAHDTSRVADPIYYFNYAMYTVNDRLYFYLLKPLASGYKAVVPTPARSGVRNFFHNLLFPVRFANNLLQGKLQQASDEIGIFLVNTTAGVLGFNQVAQKHLDMHTKTEDLGQTLGTYHITEGFYLVLPFFGPSTLRDTLGRAGDSFISPLNHVEPWELAWGLRILDTVNQTSFRIGDYEDLKAASLDPYTAIKNAYIQNRRSQVNK
ncbi:MAG: VacJ family lipoprotein [Desulfotignum sp.]|nr:VacJ family lipoprotein [Desulfotignum sp.]